MLREHALGFGALNLNQMWANSISHQDQPT